MGLSCPLKWDFFRHRRRHCFNFIFVTAFASAKLKLTRYLGEEALASGIEVIDTSRIKRTRARRMFRVACNCSCTRFA